ncbi:MAG: DUF5711 family protein [Clostridia bacterium]
MENEEKKEYQIQREINIRKIIITGIVVVLILAVVIIFSLYIAEEGFRKWVDINVLRKDISSESVATVDLNVDKNNQIVCYNKYIGILNEKNLKIYNSAGENITDISVNINTAIFSTNDRYLAIAEKNGQELCVISDKTYLWTQKVDGEIQQICVNKNGYVILVTTDTTYKSIITVYDNSGKQLMRNFLSSSRVTDVSISDDNKYLAYSEIDTSGTLIKSSVKIISIEKAQSNSAESTIYTKEAETSKMILKIQYQENGELVCVYDDSINIVKDGYEQELIKKEDEATFVSGNLGNSIAYIKEEQRSAFNSSSTLNIVNTSSKQTYKYNFGEIAKEMYTTGNVIGINIGTEIYFVKTNGMLIKKYTSNQEITNVMITNNIAIIIYKDRIEVINL